MLHATYLGSIVRQAVGPYELKVVPELAFRLVLLLLYFLEHSLQVHGVGNYCNDGLERTPEARVNRNHRHNNPEHQLLPPASRTLRHRGYPRRYIGRCYTLCKRLVYAQWSRSVDQVINLQVNRRTGRKAWYHSHYSGATFTKEVSQV